MKLGVSYNLFDGEELLESSIKASDVIRVLNMNLTWNSEKV